jgi:hypothetical protein
MHIIKNSHIYEPYLRVHKLPDFIHKRRVEVLKLHDGYDLQTVKQKNT